CDRRSGEKAKVLHPTDEVTPQSDQACFQSTSSNFTRPFRNFNIGSDRMAWTRVSDLERGKVYMEGTVHELLKMTGWTGNRVIYFGDQIYSDLADITLNFGWRTVRMSQSSPSCYNSSILSRAR